MMRQLALLIVLATAVALETDDKAAVQKISQERKVIKAKTGTVVSKAMTGTVHAAKRRMRAGLVDATWTPAVPWGQSTDELAKLGGDEEKLELTDDLEERATSSYFVHKLDFEVNETTAD